MVSSVASPIGRGRWKFVVVRNNAGAGLSFQSAGSDGSLHWTDTFRKPTRYGDINRSFWRYHRKPGRSNCLFMREDWWQVRRIEALRDPSANVAVPTALLVRGRSLRPDNRRRSGWSTPNPDGDTVLPVNAMPVEMEDRRGTGR